MGTGRTLQHRPYQPIPPLPAVAAPPVGCPPAAVRLFLFTQHGVHVICGQKVDDNLPARRRATARP
eukprot:scaffold17383_cov93-Isochrysis_galbana.AAC.1